MKHQNAIQIFEQKQVRTLWDPGQEKWYISIVDVIAVLTESPNPNNYWKVLKSRLKKEGSQLVTDCNQLKMQSSAGAMFQRRDIRFPSAMPTTTAQILALPHLHHSFF